MGSNGCEIVGLDVDELVSIGSDLAIAVDCKCRMVHTFFYS